MLHFQPREAVEETHYELVFRLEDGQRSTFAFACDEHGDVFRNQLPQIARYGLELCFKGEVDGYTVRRGVLRYHTQSFIEDASGTCVCGEHVIAAKTDLEVIKTRYTLEGFSATNDKSRLAELNAKTENERDAVALTEKGLREAQLELDLANLRVQEATMLLKVVEQKA